MHVLLARHAGTAHLDQCQGGLDHMPAVLEFIYYRYTWMSLSSLLHFSPAVSEEVLGLGVRAVLDLVAGMMVPEGTSSVASAGHVHASK